MRMTSLSKLACLVVLLAILGDAHATPTPVLPPPSKPLASGTVTQEGGTTIVATPHLRRWPVQLDPAVQCAPAGCTQREQLEMTLNRAAQWLAAFPESELRFDAAVGLNRIRQIVDSDALRRAFEQARVVADRDADHPQRRFWNPGFTVPAEQTSRWAVPTDGSRVNPNRVLDEALHCAHNGWRRETMQYACGAMRDAGGYQTVHALWAVDIASRNGCVAAADLTPCVAALQAELKQHQPSELQPKATLDIDLFAERLLFLMLTGEASPLVDHWAKTLLQLQATDGSWGVATDNEPPYYRYHATNAATWALAEWFRRVEK